MASVGAGRSEWPREVGRGIPPWHPQALEQPGVEGRACQLDLDTLFIPGAFASWLWDLRHSPSLSSTVGQKGTVMINTISTGVERLLTQRMYASERKRATERENEEGGQGSPFQGRPILGGFCWVCSQGLQGPPYSWGRLASAAGRGQEQRPRKGVIPQESHSKPRNSFAGAPFFGARTPGSRFSAALSTRICEKE